MATIWHVEAVASFVSALDDDVAAAGFRLSICNLPLPLGASRKHLGLALAPTAARRASLTTLQSRLQRRGYRLFRVPQSPATFCTETPNGGVVHFC